METPKPKIAGTSPLEVQLKAGDSVWWCSCGLSQNQPFCDGSHKADGQFSPVEYVAEKDGSVWFCNCKCSKNSPMCDGSHKGLSAD